MKTLLLGLSAATALAAGASAAPIDLLTHGSAGSFGAGAISTGSTGWTTTATDPGNRVSIQQTPGTPTARFVDDTATETLSRSVPLGAGTVYSLGFDDQMQTGNPNPFSLSVTLGSPAMTSVMSAAATRGAWFDASQTVLAPASGAYTFDFTDRSGITAAVASLVDRVCVAGAPAPFSMALLGCGLVGIGLVRRRAR